MRFFPITCLFVSFLTISLTGCAEKKLLLQPTENGSICLNVNSGKMWQTDKGGPFSSLQEAQLYAEALQLGGYDDWRLPSTEEMFQLFHLSFWQQNTQCNLNQNGEFWSISKDGKAQIGHWETYILCDPEFTYVKTVKPKGYVRAIRP
ncbi:Lcl domain-containing protein [Desulfogranum japonicum]|uniref:Lcl domain-containing protein n=1 Tax=Desulfogranum japonicum TaxID=231447 RepID=UPI00041C210D|nr:DUF1566 domain-containing protein [Desulfogranum japonicum]